MHMCPRISNCRSPPVCSSPIACFVCFRCAASANTRSTWQAKELEKRAEEEAKRKAKELSGTLAAEKTAQKSLENMDSSKLPPVDNLEPGCGVDKPWRLSGDARVSDWTKGTDVSVALAQFGAEYKGGAGFRQDQRASATMRALRRPHGQEYGTTPTKSDAMST